MIYYPKNLDFDVAFEDTKVHDKRYVVNNATGEYIGIVGDKFNCVSHEKFFSGVYNTMLSNLGEDELATAKIDWRHARQNAWALMDVTLPDTTHTITTDKHQTKVGQRDCVAWRGWFMFQHGILWRDRFLLHQWYDSWRA